MPSFLNKVANPCLNTSSPDFLACCAMSRVNLDSVTTGVIHLHPPAEDRWHCGCPHMRRDKRGADSSLLPSEGTSPVTPWPWASGLQNSERIHFCGIKLPTFWYFVTAATETNKTPYLDGILFLFLKKILFYSRTVDWQCFVNFCCTTQWFNLHIYGYYFSHSFPSGFITGY